MDNSMLDELDKKILYELDVDARQPISKIAKKFRISKQVANYRIKGLEERGIIKGYYAFLDIGKLGYMKFRAFLKFYNTTPEKEREIIEYLKNNKNVAWVARVDGYWNIVIHVFAKSVLEFHTFWEELSKKYINYIDDKQISIITHTIHYRKKFLVETVENPGYEISGGEVKKDVDLKDEKILEILSENARMPLVDISKRAGLSIKIVAYRIKEMKKRGVILTFKPFLDIEKLNLKYYKIHFYLKDVEDNTKKMLMEYTRKHPNIAYLMIAVGGADFEIEILARNEEEFHSVLDDIKAKFSNVMKKYESMRYFNEYKFIYIPVNLIKSN